jgi:hypothetical protein
MSDSDKREKVLTAYGTPTFTGILTPCRMESSTPAAYRLAKKPNGEVVLQGAYQWTDGKMGGFTWRDIPTVELTETGGEP